MKQEILRMHHVTSYDKNILQLKDFNLHLFSGEILSLIPINNQGLETLLSLFRQNMPIQSGYIYYKEKLINSWKGASSTLPKISLIQSKSSLVEDLTLFDNIFVLRSNFRSFIIRSKLLKQQLQPFFDEIHLKISPSSYIYELSTFERLVVELIKAIVSGSKLVVLNEIGSFLSESDLARYHKIIRYYAEKGISFLYVGYHFEEVRLISDRTALLLNGSILKTVQNNQPIPYTIAYINDVRKDIIQKETLQENRIFQVKNMSVGSVGNVSFSISVGECIVLHTLTSQIYSDLLAIFAGEKKPHHGTMLLNNDIFDGTYSRDIAIISKQPPTSMLFSKLSYIDNLCFTIDHKLPEIWFSRNLKKNLKKQFSLILSKDIFEQSIENLSIEQKYELVYGRILLQNPKIVFCIQPFNNADVSLRMLIRNLIKKLVKQKIAVIIIAINLADSLSIADRLIRITSDGSTEVYEQKNFSDISFSAPWVDLYKE